ncbi:hypothetical protein IM774_08470 [Erysipelotrichaceae bacterium RD49]|nr:hypothetical protein [Erysipelotrichaceae bacterium RD49]
MHIKDLKNPVDLLIYVYFRDNLPSDLSMLKAEDIYFLADIQTNQTNVNLLKLGAARRLQRNPHAIQYNLKDRNGRILRNPKTGYALVSNAIQLSPSELCSILYSISPSNVLLGFPKDASGAVPFENMMECVHIINVLAFLKPFEINGASGYTIDFSKPVCAPASPLSSQVPLLQANNTHAAMQRYRQEMRMQIIQYPPEPKYIYVSETREDFLNLIDAATQLDILQNPEKYRKEEQTAASENPNSDTPEFEEYDCQAEYPEEDTYFDDDSDIDW